MVLLKIIALLLAFVTIQALIYPPPVHEQYGTQFLMFNGICSIFQLPLQHQVIDTQYYLNKILKRLNNHKNCQRSLFYNPNQHTLLNLAIISTIKAEGYQIEINEEGIYLRFSDYSGYVYGLESLSQIIKGNKAPFAMIKDEPLVGYRGLMIDSSRHFLSVDAIKRVLESMSLSKLNILHWHLTDDQAFTIVLKSHPELAEFGSYSAQQTYSLEDMQSVIALANLNAIQVVPEMDNPSHVHAWGLNPQWTDLVLNCSGDKGFDGQLDLSKNNTLIFMKDIIKEFDQIFASSPYLHFGGDEIWPDCWDSQPQIKTFMKANNIDNYGALQMYWRAQLKSVLSPERKIIFWLNVAANVTTSGNDILQYWGDQAQVANITSGNDSPIILSPINPLYLSLGQGNLWLNGSQGIYAVWKTIYQKFQLYPEGVDKARILGAEVCLFGEVSNEDTLENNLWMRSSAFAFRVWSDKILPLNEVVASLVDLQKILEQMGVDPSPVTSEFCQQKPEVCFPPEEQMKDSQTQPILVEI